MSAATCAIVVYARDEPKAGRSQSGANQRYRFPRITLEQRPLGKLPAGCIRVRIARAGVCGTDFHLLETAADGYTRCSSPACIPPQGRVLGHEAVGIIHAIGSGVGHLRPGDWVCLESIITCHTCPKCRQGHFNQCQDTRLLGMEEDGLFTEFADVPATLAHNVNDLAQTNRQLEALVCVEAAAVAYLACQNARLQPGESMAILGAGPIGFYVALLARRCFGASRVTLVEPSAFRHKFAADAAIADRVLQPAEFASDDQPCDVLVDAAGDLAAVSHAIPRLNGNGRIILLSRTGGAFVTDHVDQIISRSLHVIGSRGHLGGAFESVLALCRSRRLDLRAPVTHVVAGLGPLADILAHPARFMANQCKIVVDLGPQAGSIP